ncbi:glycosyltransferase family 4 protein [Erythrobacter sp. SDW2]|uniref:glycosyltransferase family 4 protein n=1 Tax=Erythrobacter sp. SDW2 TaxID=2907154 RepID=UPI001F22EDBD|nr:glycosyltransferase family 4 protein [Erythrobacter sp. SDW2]UIP07377.1 glycosyltransferase family 4 protein [Erythrobacter sp. SDW2]
MKILILYRHFWPDSPPYASMLRSIARRLATEGHEVTIWTQEPSYKQSDLALRMRRREMVDGIRVERFGVLPGFRRIGPVRVLDKLAFPIRLLLKALWRRLKGERYDLVWTATIPPVAQGMIGRWIAALFGAKFLYHCQDLYPELGGHSGIWKEGGLLDRMLSGIERRNRAHADVLVALSDDMAATVRGLASPRGELEVINNFMLENFAGEDAKAALPPPPVREKVRLIFAGNLGQFQGLDLLVEAMKLVEAQRQDIELVFMGEGKALAGLKAQAAGLRAVVFEPHRPFEAARAEIAAADVGIVSLEPGLYRLAFPSKTLTYLGLGLPLLCVVEPESQLARMVADNGLGWVAPRDPAAIAAAICRIGDERAHLPAMRGKASEWFATKLDRPAVLDRWSAMIGGLEGARP